MGPEKRSTWGHKRYSGVTTTKPRETRWVIWALGTRSVDPRTNPPAWKMRAIGCGVEEGVVGKWMCAGMGPAEGSVFQVKVVEDGVDIMARNV
jgi:hypothetical protein